MKRVLIVGATSAIAEQCARQWAERGDRLYLAARDRIALDAVLDNLRARGAQPEAQHFEAADFAQHAALLASAVQALGGLDIVLIAHGTLTDQARAQSDVDYALHEIQVNGTSTVSLMTLAAQHLATQGHGSLGVISSVAGDRGRQSNYVYGSAKALVSTFASGLRQRLHPLGIAVVTIKPGFVETPMTRHLPKGGPLWARPEAVARDIVAALDGTGKVVYTPFFWRAIMSIIKHLPETLFRTLRL